MDEHTHLIHRIGLVYWLVVLLGVAIIVQIVRLQFNPRLKNPPLSFKEEELPALRGNILANDGRVLAISLPYYELRLDCTVTHDTVFNKYVGPLSAGLANFFKDKSAEQYKTELIRERGKGNKYKKVGTRWVNYTELQEIKKLPLFNLGRNRGGLVVEQKSRRTNPYNRLAHRTIGWQNSIGVGVGIEDAFDDYLRGKPGKRMIQLIPGGEWMPVNSDINKEPHDGMDVVTTLDVDIQDAAETALRGLLLGNHALEAGTAIVMETATGEIRAIANMMRNSDGTYDEAFNYAIGQSTEPGSTFKLATLISLLEDNYVTLQTPVNTENGRWLYHNKVFTDSHGGLGTISMREVLEQSSNVGFAKTAVQFYAKGKEKQFVDRLFAMNLNKPLGLQIKGEGSPRINYPGDKGWDGLSLPMMAMGYAITLTPMHTLTFYNAVANNGKMVKPKFVKAIQTKDGNVQKEFATEVISSSICSPAVLKDVRTALRSVVEKGTARAINDSRYSIAGKTGTSRLLMNNGLYEQNGLKKHQASFVGFFPAEAPRYTAIVVLYSEVTTANFYGATWAAPIFKQIADKLYVASSDWATHAQANTDKPGNVPSVKGGKKSEVENVLRELNVPATHTPKNVQWVSVQRNKQFVEEVAKNISSKTVPSVVNMGLKDALFLLENLDLQVSFSGKGQVLRQSIEAGSPVIKGQQIYLELGI